MQPTEPIPQEWIREYVDKLIETSAYFDESSPMRRAATDRADAVMDMVKEFRREMNGD